MEVISHAALRQIRFRAQSASNSGDVADALRWWERAWRSSGRSNVASLEFAVALSKAGDRRAAPLLEFVSRRDVSFPTLFALAAAYRREGQDGRALSTMVRLLRTTALETLEPAGSLAGEIAAGSGLAGWIGWRRGDLVFGSLDIEPDALQWRIGRRRVCPDWQRRFDRIWTAAMPDGVVGAVTGDRVVLGAGLRADLFRQVEGSATYTGERLEGWARFAHDPGRPPALIVSFQRGGARIERPVTSLRPSEPPSERPFSMTWVLSEALPADAHDVRLRERETSHEIAVHPSTGMPQAGRTAAPETAAVRSAAAARLLTLCSGKPTILLVTHDEGGGVERHVQDRLGAIHRQGSVGILIRSQRGQPGTVRIEIRHNDAPYLSFDPAKSGEELIALLRALRPARIEFHQMRRHPDLVWDLPGRLGVPHDVHLHDYAFICPRVTLVGDDGRYCGEPPLRACERCADRFAHREVFAPAGVAALRRQSARLIASAERVIAPSHDIARRFDRYVPRSYKVRPHERSPAPSAVRSGMDQLAQVCVVGAINQHKGYDVLLACARDAAIRGLPIRFTVVGHTSDDEALIEAGVFVTGAYDEAERADLIARQRPRAGFLPSIWPEPWCYALTGLLAAGLPTLCFDIGAQADRVRRAGGSVIPLRTESTMINRELIKLSHSSDERCWL